MRFGPSWLPAHVTWSSWPKASARTRMPSLQATYCMCQALGSPESPRMPPWPPPSVPGLRRPGAWACSPRGNGCVTSGQVRLWGSPWGAHPRAHTGQERPDVQQSCSLPSLSWNKGCSVPVTQPFLRQRGFQKTRRQSHGEGSFFFYGLQPGPLGGQLLGSNLRGTCNWVACRWQGRPQLCVSERALAQAPGSSPWGPQGRSLR